MKILNVNRRETTTDQRIAFDVEGTLDQEALSMVQLPRVHATFVERLLVLETRSAEQRVLLTDVDEFLASYTAAELRLAKQAFDARAEHDRLLQEISNRLEIPLGPVKVD